MLDRTQQGRIQLNVKLLNSTLVLLNVRETKKECQKIEEQFFDDFPLDRFPRSTSLEMESTRARRVTNANGDPNPF